MPDYRTLDPVNWFFVKEPFAVIAAAFALLLAVSAVLVVRALREERRHDDK